MAGRLDGVRVVVGVGGGIAAYKAVELVRALQTEGATVRVAMTPAAQKFVGPLTFEALTRHNVMTDVMALAADKSIEHVEWGHWAQVLVVAPATADVLARMAAGHPARHRGPAGRWPVGVGAVRCGASGRAAGHCGRGGPGHPPARS